MFDFLEVSKSLWGNLKSYYEAQETVNIEFNSVISNLPVEDDFLEYLAHMKSRDEVTIVMHTCTDDDFEYSSKGGALWQDKYQTFISENDQDDEVTISINIVKKIDDNNILSIYCMERFLEYFGKTKPKIWLEFFADVFSKREYLCFEVSDEDINISTNSICFFTEESDHSILGVSRECWLKKCEDDSLFLNRIDIPLLPFDFQIKGECTVADTRIVSFFRKMETIFSYLYLANSSYILDEKIVLQISQTNKRFAYNMDSINYNESICKLFYWTFGEDNITEKAGIVRNAIEISCKTQEQILDITDEIFYSIKSNYKLYQKHTVEQYIEMKHQISSYIINTTKEIQDIVHNMIEGLKNNFVAVILFLITTILTDSLDWEDFLETHQLSRGLLFVSKIFIVASFAYLFVTIVIMVAKWFFYKNGYEQLKNNYREILEEQDLKNAFDNDRTIEYARNRVIIYSGIIGVVWIVFLLFIYCYMCANGNVTSIEQSEKIVPELLSNIACLRRLVCMNVA